MNEPNRHTPDPGKDFGAARMPQPDAANWEPLEDREDETVGELRHDPPRKVYTPDRAMVPTPFGTIEQEVRRDLGPAEQRAIGDVERRPREIDDDFADLRSIDAVPGAGAEYEEFVRQSDPSWKDYERRVSERFNRMRERERDLDR